MRRVAVAARRLAFFIRIYLKDVHVHMRAYQKLSTGSNNLQLSSKIEMEFVFIIWNEFTLRFRVGVILSLYDIETAFSMMLHWSFKSLYSY